LSQENGFIVLIHNNMVRKSTKVPLTTAVNGHTTSAEKRPIEVDLDVDLEDEQPTTRTKLPDRTDYNRWRLLDESGRQTWHYLEDDEEVKKWPQTSADKYFLGLPTVGPYPMPNFIRVS
jgi:hypothetical protein